ncbi:DUF402 domain-containing protein [Nocardioides ochotonae]|uniref:DUF402 domain-containing protein n=1 Tax=Nocardioides ochotonae TaxID=2685869 RepID=UPI00140AF3D7|nr:DUF402 domain-containing protein [Nocardioides ochotonae]
MPTATGSPGSPVRVEMAKWGGGAHWEFDGVLLGSDEHGEWLGFPAGTLNARPGARYLSQVDSVTLVSPTAWSLPTFQAPGIWCTVYVDIASPPRWDREGEVPVLRSVDLDLDVIRGDTGRVWIDDEDEFAAHRVALGYPADVVRAALAECERVHHAVASGHPPYDGTAERWLAQVSGLRPR